MTTTLARHVRLITAAALLTTTLACGKDDGPQAPENVTGKYTLQTVNGNPPPVTLIDFSDQTGSYKLELLGGWVSVNANGTFTEEHSWRETENGVVTSEGPESGSGTYTRNGNTLTFVAATGETTTATYASGVLTVTDGPFTARYSR